MTKVDEKDKEVESINGPEEWTDDSLDEKKESWFQQNQRTVFFSVVGLALLAFALLFFERRQDRGGKRRKERSILDSM